MGIYNIGMNEKHENKNMKCAYSICIMLELYNDTVPTSKCI
jgi:hypothetical protein